MKLTQTPITKSELEALEGEVIRPEFAGGTIGDVISLLIKYLFPLAGLLLLLYLLYGGYQFMLSHGDPKAIQQAKGIITTALIGFIIVFVSYWIVILVAQILGLQPILDIF